MSMRLDLLLLLRWAELQEAAAAAVVAEAEGKMEDSMNHLDIYADVGEEFNQEAEYGGHDW